MCENKSSRKLIPYGVCTMLYVVCSFKMLKTRTRVGFIDVGKHSGKLQLFNMCGSQDIDKLLLHQISFKLKCF